MTVTGKRRADELLICLYDASPAGVILPLRLRRTHSTRQMSAFSRRSSDAYRKPVAQLIRGVQLDFGYAALLLGNFEEAQHLFAALLEQEERGNDDERIGNRSSDVALAIMNRALRSDIATDRTRLCDEARAYVKRSQQRAENIGHAVQLGECDFHMAALARIQGIEAEYQRLTASDRRRFEELGIRRKGRAEQFVIFPEAENSSNS